MQPPNRRPLFGGSDLSAAGFALRAASFGHRFFFGFFCSFFIDVPLDIATS
jgi:hypothetical protein